MNAPSTSALEKLRIDANKLEKRLRRLAGQAIADFNMIEAGDRVMVCLSGGKDSYGLLDVLLKLRDARADRLRHRRGEPRPEASGLSRRRCCPIT